VGGVVTPADVYAVAVAGRPVHAGDAARARMAASSAYLARCVAERRVIYGVTTGFGPLARHHVAPEHAAALQRNLLYHLAAGVGAPLPRAHVRALMAARAASLARGWSGVGAEVFDLLLACLNRGVTPVVPEKGSVGASGDLTPLAHVALVLVGEGRAAVGGRELPGAEALRAAGLAPAALGHKEGLALVNGTSASAGIAAVNAERAARAAALMARLAVLHAEVLGGHAEAWDARFGALRPHPGQREAHRRLAALARGSRRLTPSVQPPPHLEAAGPDGVFDAPEPPQDPYTVRCVPQELGAVLDVLDFHARTVAAELASATDNPLVVPPDAAAGRARRGAARGQLLRAARGLRERRAVHRGGQARGVERARAGARRQPAAQPRAPGLPHGGAAGLNSGFMGAQVTATALVAELRTRAVPASVQTIPTNNDNQDVVTMATIAARRTSEALDLAWQVLAVQALALARAAELRAADAGRGGAGGAGALAAAGFAPASAALVAAVRAVAPPLDGDRPLSAEIEAAARALERWPALAADADASAAAARAP
jgi:tyrosine ammonia-lyase